MTKKQAILRPSGAVRSAGWLRALPAPLTAQITLLGSCIVSPARQLQLARALPYGFSSLVCTVPALTPSINPCRGFGMGLGMAEIPQPGPVGSQREAWAATGHPAPSLFAFDVPLSPPGRCHYLHVTAFYFCLGVMKEVSFPWNLISRLRLGD